MAGQYALVSLGGTEAGAGHDTLGRAGGSLFSLFLCLQALSVNPAPLTSFTVSSLVDQADGSLLGTPPSKLGFGACRVSQVGVGEEVLQAEAAGKQGSRRRDSA